MKKAAALILLSLVCASSFAQELVRPLVAPAFGKPVVVTAEFVAKPNTYYAQNIVKAPHFLKVISVDGRALKEPIVIEYILEAGKKEKLQLERTSAVHEFEAYETLYQPISATPWLGEGEQGSEFYLENLLHIRAAKKKALPPRKTAAL